MKLDTTPFALHGSTPGARPKLPIAARVTLGRQPPDRLGSGYPIAKDRLWICSPIADGEKVQGRGGSYTQRFLPLHPDFARFNYDPALAVEQWDDRNHGADLDAMIRGEAPQTPEQHLMARALAAIPENRRPYWRDAMEAHRKSRRILRGVIVHRNFLSSPASLNDAAWLRYAAQGAKPTRGESLIPHPQRLPACISSDGKIAHRWDGKTYVQRPCLAEKCPFRAAGSAEQGPGQACGKTISVVFQLRWPTLCWCCSGLAAKCPECKGTGTAAAMPSALVEIEASGSFNFAAQAFTSFFEDVDRQWKALDLPGEPDYIGLPFMLQMQHKTGEGKSYWTLHVAADFEAGESFQSWAFARAQMRAVGRRMMVAPAVPMIEEAEDPRAAFVRTRIGTSSVPGEVLDG